ncbi:WxL domain-containing protein [Levilactobacillus spicheri]|nr:WxL domain-containing protein [Levilactobacillus spicheri]
MTKKTLQLLATVALVTGMGLASATTAHAADTTGTATTSGNVALTAEGDEGGATGGVKLAAAPNVSLPDTQMNGGDQTIEGFVSAAALGKANDGVVTAINAGHKTDWQVQVASSPFVSGSDTMNASTLVMTGTNATTTGTGVAPSTLNKAITFNTGSTTPNQNVMTADYTNKGEGVGTWSMNYSGATLSLKAGNVAGNYASTLTWTLTNTPVS